MNPILIYIQKISNKNVWNFLTVAIFFLINNKYFDINIIKNFMIKAIIYFETNLIYISIIIYIYS